MNRKLLSLLLLPPFALLTAWSLTRVGLAGILGIALSPGGAQVFADLAISLLLLLTFLFAHARAAGRNAGLWAVLTLCLGSFAPLLYFITAKEADTSARAPAKGQRP